MDRRHLTDIERGRIKQPGRKYLERIAKALGLTFEELATQATPTSSASGANGLDRFRVLVLRVPIIGEAHAGPEGILGPIEDYAYWSGPKVADGNIIGVICRGFCLEPEVREGDVIFIDQELSAGPGDIVVVAVDDEIRLVLWDGGQDELPKGATIQGVVVEIARRRRRRRR